MSARRNEKNMSASRTTLVIKSASRDTAPREWNVCEDSEIVFVPTITVLRYAIENGVRTLPQDVERVVIDRVSSGAEYVELLAALPKEFEGDVMYIRADETALLSSREHAGNRVLRVLRSDDVQFYLGAQGLTASSPLALAA